MFLSYDDARMRTPESHVRALRPRLREAHETLETLRKSGEQGFFDLPYAVDAARLCETHAKRLAKKFDQLLVIGIGGSDLGARAIFQAVGGSRMRLQFLTNPDPESIGILLEQTDWKRTAVNVVSRSGTTLETMSLFEIVRDELRKHTGKTAQAEHVIATTLESKESALYTLARREGYAVIRHPENVGGRFSVLSGVGLFPAACSGTPVRRLLAGARWLEDHRRALGLNALPVRFTTHHYIQSRAGRDIHVLMPYAEQLFPFAMWYRQLWAESLGKRRGKISVGPTPVAAFGPADQHSQIQLYNHGPDNKVVTFIEVDRFKRAVRVPGGIRLARMLHIEREATARALTHNKRPTGTLHIPSVSPESLGALFMMYETSVAYFGQLLDINAYDQPGVEAGKNEMQRLLTA